MLSYYKIDYDNIIIYLIKNNMPVAFIVLTAIMGVLEFGPSCVREFNHRRPPSSPPPPIPADLSPSQGDPIAVPLELCIAYPISPDDEGDYIVATAEPVELLSLVLYTMIMGTHDGLTHEDWKCFEHAEFIN